MYVCIYIFIELRWNIWTKTHIQYGCQRYEQIHSLTLYFSFVQWYNPLFCWKHTFIYIQIHRHTFKISYLGLTGRNVSAAFGSSKPQEVKRLRAVIRDVIHLSKKASKKQSKKDKNDIYNDNASSMFKVSNAKSEVTALSNTVYGRNTMTNQAAKRFNSNNQRF